MGWDGSNVGEKHVYGFLCCFSFTKQLWGAYDVGIIACSGPEESRLLPR